LPLRFFTFSVVVRDLDFVGMTGLPDETDAVLIVDSYAVLPFAIALQLLEPIARRDGELADLANPVELVELATSDSPKLPGTRP
jgi:hypothetical protein